MSASRGFTLTEVLVAIALLAMLTAGGLTAYGQAHAAWRATSTAQRLHERAQYVFATLEPELQMAGYFGDGLPPTALADDAIPAAAQSCGPALVGRLDVAVESAASFNLPCAAKGGGALPDSQLLIVRRVAVRPATAEPGHAQWRSVPDRPGELLWNDAAAAADPPASERHELRLHAYYVARQSDSDPATPALRVKSLGSVAGVPAFIDTEVMPGVEQLQVELLPSPAAPRRVRLTLRVRADAAELRAGVPPRLTVTRHFALRDAPGT